jgi:hypothetical protein
LTWRQENFRLVHDLAEELAPRGVTPSNTQSFQPEQVAHLPEAARRSVDEEGRLASVKMPRWGNPEGAEFHAVDFGGVAEEERTFGGYTIPMRLRIGWYFGNSRFESEGELFRVTVDDATYR